MKTLDDPSFSFVFFSLEHFLHSAGNTSLMMTSLKSPVILTNQLY